jgi:hypothetical protein
MLLFQELYQICYDLTKAWQLYDKIYHHNARKAK